MILSIQCATTVAMVMEDSWYMYIISIATRMFQTTCVSGYGIFIVLDTMYK